MVLQAARRRGDDPLVAVAVAVEAGRARRLDRTLDRGERCVRAATGLLDPPGDRRQTIGDDRVHDCHRPSGVLRRSHGTELKLVPSKGDGARAVPVGVVLRDLRDAAPAELEHRLGRAGGQVAVVGECVADLAEQVAEEDRHDRRGGLVRAETEVVAVARDRRAEQAAVAVNREQHGGHHREEAEVGRRIVPRLQQVLTVGGERPVVVLATAVHAGERLLVEKHAELVPQGDAPQDLHRQLVVVDRDVDLGEDRRDLVLRGRHLVVARLGRHPHLVQFDFHFLHERLHARGDRAEVVVLKALALGGSGADDRAPADRQIGAQGPVGPVDQEVLLLAAQRRDHAVGLVAERAEQRLRRRVDRLHRTKQRGLLVERFAGVADERRRDAQRVAVGVLHDEDRARRVPRGVATRLKGRTHAAGGERARVRLGLDQGLSGERLERVAVSVEGEEGVMLFGRQPRHRLEPVGVVRTAVGERPLLDRLRDGIGFGTTELGALEDR